ncbi:type VI secretion system tube protein Hcp [Akkermansiaceae bacterium]|nr:type VI secretion system tube protein Hcp [Akkermansiaceae bacterium]
MLILTSDGGSGQQTSYYKVEFKNVFVSSYSSTGTGENEVP